MAKKQIEKEIEILRAQVDELIAARNSKEADIVAVGDQDTEMRADKMNSEQHSHANKDANDVDEEIILEQFQELIKTVDQELKEASTVTVLLVFSLGVVVGRLLSR